MACKNTSRYIPSDLEFILNYFDHLPKDDSDSDFDGYIDDSASEDEESPTDHCNSFPNKTSTSFSITSVPSTPPNQPLLVVLPPTQVCIHNI